MHNKQVVPYPEIAKLITLFGKEQIDLVTLPGLPDWNLVYPSLQLLAQYPNVEPDNPILAYGSYSGALAAYLARKFTQAQVTISDINFTALEAAHRTLEINHCSSVSILAEIDLPQDQYQKFGSVMIMIPKGRQLGRRWLVQAYHALSNGGKLFLAGSNNEGIHSLIKDAQELFGSGQVLAYKKGHRIAQFIRKTSYEPGPDWARAPGIAPHTWVEFTITLPKHTFPIRSLPGVFSYDHLDEGTQMLINMLQIQPDTKVLDVGCGYGIIGLFAAVQGAALVHLIDNNLLAVAASRENLALNHILTADVFAGNILDPIVPNMYDLILTNPPFHTGHTVDYHIAHAMISQSFQALNPGGKIIIVSNRFIRYDRLVKEVFGNVTSISESGKFHVLSGLKSSH